MSDVFISYTRPELALVEPLRNKLVDLRLHCFFDTENLDSGDLWARKIDREVKAARCVLGCWSKAALESEWVNNECREGWRVDNRRLVAVAIAPFTRFDVPVEFNAVQYEDLQGYKGDDSDRRFIHLLDPIGRYVGRSGLAQFQRNLAARDMNAMVEWVSDNSTDPLAPEALMRVTAAQKRDLDAVGKPSQPPPPPPPAKGKPSLQRPRLKFEG